MGTEENNIAFESSSHSYYLDALNSLHIDDAPPDVVLQHQLTVLQSGGGRSRIDSPFLYGTKPPWGWDYILSFKLPKSLRCKLTTHVSTTPIPRYNQPVQPVHCDDDDDADDADEQNVAEGTAKGCCGVFGRRQGRRQQQTINVEGGTERCRNLTRVRVDILSRLKTAGFVFSQLVVPSENVILVRLSLPESRLKEKAIHVGLELKLKKQYGGGFLSYATERDSCFVNDDLCSKWQCYFSPSDRALIILAVLQSKEHWGCDLDLERLEYDHSILQAFALHSYPARSDLIKRAVWARWWDPTWKPPFDELKEYLGARVTFYFVFVSFYARRLLFISLGSIPAYVAYRVLENRTLITILLWLFSVFLVMWTTFFLETWKRRNAYMNIFWGLHDYKQDTVDDTRAQFVGDLRLGFYCEGGFVPLADATTDTNPQEQHHPPVLTPTNNSNAQPAVPPETPTTASSTTPSTVLSSPHNITLSPVANSHPASPQTVKKPRPLNIDDVPRNPYRNPALARNARFTSALVTSIFVLIIGALTFVLLWFRTQIINFFQTHLGSNGIASFMPGLLNGVLITISDSIWRVVSLSLTRRENHRTNQLFENSLIYKRFAFQFVSNYISLFYIAFLRPYIRKQCTVGFSGANDCMAELESQLMSLVITRSSIGQIQEILLPFIMSAIRQWRAHLRSDAMTNSSPRANNSTPAYQDPENPSPHLTSHTISSSAHNRYVHESKLSIYDSTMDDYNELVIQFGYLALFGITFPPAAAICLLNNLIEVRTDAFKILSLSQRPNADDAADIGAWYYILEFLNILSVMTNVALLVFTADSVNTIFHLDSNYGNDFWRKLLYRVVAFFIAEHILLALKGTAATVVNDVPGSTYRTVARQKFDIARWFDVGWQNAFRGVSLLQVDERQVALCQDYAELFERASEDGADNDD